MDPADAGEMTRFKLEASVDRATGRAGQKPPHPLDVEALEHCAALLSSPFHLLSLHHRPVAKQKCINPHTRDSFVCILELQAPSSSIGYTPGLPSYRTLRTIALAASAASPVARHFQ